MADRHQRPTSSMQREVALSSLLPKSQSAAADTPSRSVPEVEVVFFGVLGSSRSLPFLVQPMAKATSPSMVRKKITRNIGGRFPNGM
jgi:hypothetical protein